MTTVTIDHKTLTRLVEANAVRAAHIVGQPGGWGVIVKYGMSERPLAATRSKDVRIFKRFETLVGYLKELGISRFDVDASNFDAAMVKTYSRPDTTAALKQAHAALVHDKWFRAEVAQGLKEADDPAVRWLSNETVMAESARRRAAWLKSAAKPGRSKGGSGANRKDRSGV